jgi:hypothetical protein
MNRRYFVSINIGFAAPFALFFLLIGCGYNAKYRAVSGHGKVSITCRSVIASQDTEQAGYGGYSYIIFTHVPSSKPDTQRYRAVCKAYINCLFPDTTYIDQKLANPAELNITYWPLKKRLNLSDAKKPETILVDDYDYPRARKIIANISDFPDGVGPFILCNKRPLTWAARDVQCKKLLVFNLTGVSIDSLSFVMTCFQNRVKSDPLVGSGCEYEERKMSLLGFLRTDAPPIDWSKIVILKDLILKL